jgi:hypothetical protein
VPVAVCNPATGLHSTEKEWCAWAIYQTNIRTTL